MKSEDLDRILASEEPLAPSSGFAASVMERVHESAAEPPPLPFPWRRFLLGLAVSIALSGLLGWALATLSLKEELWAAFAASHVPLTLGEALVSLAGAYLLTRLTLGFTEAHR